MERHSARLRRIVRAVSATDESAYLTPEAKARSRSTRCSRPPAGRCRTPAVNLARRHGVAVREFIARGRHGRADYLLFVDRKPSASSRRSRRARHSPASSGSRRSTSTACRTRHERARRAAAVRLPVHRRRDALHERARPRAAQPRGLLVPPARDARRAGSATPREPARADAAAPAAAQLPELDADGSGRHRRRAIRNLEARCREPAPRADPDGDRRRQDVHGRERRLPAGQARRRPPRPLPRRPRQPRPADAEGVPGLHDARTTGASSPSSTTSSTSPRTGSTRSRA